MNEKYAGGWTAMVTPFKTDYSVDWDSLKSLIEFQVSGKITGVLPMGTTGESATVTHEEHGPIRLEKGSYRVWRQREYVPSPPSPVKKSRREEAYRYVQD